MFDKIKLWLKKKEWRKRNVHNETSIVNAFNFAQVSVGKGTYGGITAILMADDSCIKIGNYCSIGPKVIFMGGGEHNYKRISTYPFQSKVYKQKTNNPVNHSIIIEDDVWIGYDALIMPGVTIGKGSVIGARAIVTKDVPLYSIYVGNKVIKKRFSEDIINKLSIIDFSKVEHTSFDTYINYCQTEITSSNVDDILECFVTRK